MGNDISIVIGHDTLANSETDALHLIVRLLVVQALEYLEHLGDKLVIETDTVVGNGNPVELFFGKFVVYIEEFIAAHLITADRNKRFYIIAGELQGIIQQRFEEYMQLVGVSFYLW